MIVPLSLVTITVVAKPVGRNPGTGWPGGTIWGTGLHLENGIYIGEAWFGMGTAETKTIAPPDPGDVLIVEFLVLPGTKYGKWVKVASDHENWYVRMRAVGEAPT